MNSLTVIGIGSDYGDDQIGWRIVDCLRHRFNQCSAMQFLSCRRSIFDWWSDSGDATTVIFIDALAGDMATGRLLRFRISPTDVDNHSLPCFSRLSSHGLQLADAIILGQRLGQLPPLVEVWGISVASDHNVAPVLQLENPSPHGMSKTLKRRLPDIVDQCVQRLSEYGISDTQAC